MDRVCAEAAHAKVDSKGSPPRPIHGSWTTRSSDGRILHTSGDSGCTHLYDADAGSTTTVPTVMRRKGREPIVIPVVAGARIGSREEEGKERIYTLSNYGNDHHGFEILNLSRHP